MSTNNILKDIKTWNVSDCVTKFKESKDRLFSYGMKDVSDTLNCLELSVINAIREALIEEAVNIFPQLKDHRVPQRIVVRTSAKDVCNLGFSIVNKSLTKDTEKIFIKDRISDSQQDIDPLSISQMQELLESVLELSSRVSVLENEVISLKKENKELKEKVGEFNNQPALLNVEDSNCGIASSSTDTEGDDFEIPREQKKKKKRKLKKNLAKQKDDTAVKILEDTAVKTIAQNQGSPQGVPSVSESPGPGLTVSTSYRDALRNGSSNSYDKVSLRAAKKPNNVSRQTVLTDIFITGADINTPISHVDEVLKHIGVDNANIQDVTRKDGSATWRSFKAAIPVNMKDLVLQRHQWPEGISVRPFYQRRMNHPFRDNNRPFRGGPQRVLSHNGRYRNANWENREFNNNSWRASRWGQPAPADYWF